MRHRLPKVDFAAGKTGFRAKNQQGMEQVVKAAALPKPRGPRPARIPDEGGEARSDREGREGARGNGSSELWDLTAGLGTDAFVLACAGWKVRMFERSPVVAALLQVS